VIEEIKLEDFPWDDMPWARNAPGQNRLKTSEGRPEFPVLILSKDNRRVAYLCYYVFDAVNIVYVETRPDFARRGYATELVGEVCRRYRQEFDIKGQSTCTDADGSVRLLKRCGFERVSPGSVDWILRKGK
jgi:ribosomal protein S18 acetylase RimI-like enzyme